MKTGDKVKVKGRPELGSGRVIRFYANQGTVLIELEEDKKLTYCSYESLSSNESR